jgi:hypothetical protein
MSIFDFIFGKKIWGQYYVTPETEKKIQRDWANVKVMLQQKGPSQLRQALITADKDLDNALRDVVKGETMGERLKAASNRFDSITYQNIWSAHKLRNNMVHEAGYEPPHFMLTEAVDHLKTGLRVLGVNI